MAGSIQVDKHTFETFCCLFSMGGDRRKLLRWNDFVQAMTRLNFKYSPQAGGGSGRVFEPTTLGVGRKLVWDEPHGRKRGRKGAFTRVTQAALAKKAGHLVWLGQDDVCARLLQLSGAFALFSSRQEVGESGRRWRRSAGDVLAPDEQPAGAERLNGGHSAGTQRAYSYVFCESQKRLPINSKVPQWYQPPPAHPRSLRLPSRRSPKTRTYADLGVRGPVIVGVFALAMFILFVYIAPLTYGTPGLDGHSVNARRLLSSWTLHFAAKPTDGL
ncbi:hypothetical protein NUW54_g10170 [Trametes sanguinea]|uniref:Uncharacterized protein n=1 Tax=Trametes sanguinea TaxID=158606 RepID=A0ACC1P0Z7_9APHY|nr:hypothetical protein NUW54_g10170 [Trametes sanguinea]